MTILDDEQQALSFGVGSNTLKILGDGITLDFTQFQNPMQPLDVLDIRGLSADVLEGNTLTLTPFNIALFPETQEQALYVIGDAGDRVEIDDIGFFWRHNGVLQETINGETKTFVELESITFPTANIKISFEIFNQNFSEMGAGLHFV